MPGLTRRSSGLGGRTSGGSSSSTGRPGKAAESVTDSSGAARKAKTPPVPSKLSSRSVSYAKPQRTVQLLEGAPCFLPLCPQWIKAPSLW